MAPSTRTSISQPHSISLKVLRLSKPSLAVSEPIPTSHPQIHAASLAHPTQPDSPFPLTPLLTLPPSFGAAYVGESFACTLCANNERLASDSVTIQAVTVAAELQTPSTQAKGDRGVDLPPEIHPSADSGKLQAGKSRQGIIRYDLTEEGGYVLAVTVGYTEVEGQEERKRSFRKLYQFAAQQAVGVRTKIGELRGGTAGRGFAVEAQVENLTDQSVVLDGVLLELGEGLECRDLNGGERTVLAQGDVQQVAFRLEQRGGAELRVEGGRFVLAQLRVDWRMGMGQDGTLRTGWLGCLRKD
ncbi:hypothetical protein K461DRAFT_295877 [Myriangium duriaei CBS 260.36]|uniref:Trafficking protein particle complex subunit 13 N-terminal domain-containing protein n=1 Tax=Myriangium duriaei CBS 260.36 TaxID=1168546 RepID=A0A9P4IVX6_9PEZI|nr:hypothetical protein K461DRAFT_295877 [Myriangium duriaei CBS 260.36]